MKKNNLHPRKMSVLLEMVLNKFEENKNIIGLCDSVYRLYVLRNISGIEANEVIQYLRAKRPTHVKKIDRYAYWWNRRYRKPRIEYLKTHIEIQKQIEKTTI